MIISSTFHIYRIYFTVFSTPFGKTCFFIRRFMLMKEMICDWQKPFFVSIFFFALFSNIYRIFISSEPQAQDGLLLSLVRHPSVRP